MGNSRLRLGIIFTFDPRWTGGLIYNLNIIKTLSHLDDVDRPTIVVIYKPEIKRYLDEVDYPYLEWVEHTFPSLARGYLISFLKNKNVFVEDLITDNKLDAIYPMHDYPVRSKRKKKQVSWYADLQHCYYPQFFSRKKRWERKFRINLILRNSNDLVVSSQAVKDDFMKFYKVPKSLKIHIYHFVSIIDHLPDLSAQDIKAKYNLPEQYFMVSNQFQKHKNHLVVFKAIRNLKNRGVYVHVAITGRFPSDPNSEYMKELHRIVDDHQLTDSISFLGLIPREEQLLLMKYSKAVIQPSLFEGWSTVIEDAKSLQVPVIAGNLAVNREQLEEKGTYFEPEDDVALASTLEKFSPSSAGLELYEPYESRIRKAAYELLTIFKSFREDE